MRLIGRGKTQNVRMENERRAVTANGFRLQDKNNRFKGAEQRAIEDKPQKWELVGEEITTHHCIHGSSCPEAEESSLYAMVASRGWRSIQCRSGFLGALSWHLFI